MYFLIIILVVLINPSPPRANRPILQLLLKLPMASGSAASVPAGFRRKMSPSHADGPRLPATEGFARPFLVDLVPTLFDGPNQYFPLSQGVSDGLVRQLLGQCRRV